jgi:hypothetical protein
VARKSPDESVMRIIDPLDDVNQFTTKSVKQAHRFVFR